MTGRDVVILGAARTPIGKFGGSFRDVHAAELGATAAKAAIARSGITAADRVIVNPPDSLVEGSEVRMVGVSVPVK